MIWTVQYYVFFGMSQEHVLTHGLQQIRVAFTIETCPVAEMMSETYFSGYPS